MKVYFFFIFLEAVFCWIFSSTSEQNSIPDTTAFINEAAKQATRELADSEIKGISEFDQEEYKENRKFFTCGDEAQTLVSMSKVNDDYCDCPNGRDEPSTSACSYILSHYFFCNNFGYKSVEIPNARVNDGICDCCDGSDELLSGANCENNCEVLGEEYRAQREKDHLKLINGKKKKEEYLKIGKNMMGSLAVQKEEFEVQLSRLETEIKNIEGEIAVLEKKAAISDIEEAEARVKGLKLHELPREELEFMLVILAEYSGLGLKLEQMTRDALEDISLPKNDNEEVGDYYGDSYYESASSSSVTWLEHVERCESNEHEVDSNVCVSLSDTTSENKRLLSEMNSKLVEFQESKSTLEKKLKKEPKLDLDFGPDNVLFALNGKCFTKQAMEYKYEVCLYGKASQDKIDLGKYSGLEVFPSGEMWMSFTKGRRCHNKVYRSLTLKLKCGDYEEIGEVLEPSMCEYEADMFTPAAC